jgi:hypothetical protein
MRTKVFTLLAACCFFSMAVRLSAQAEVGGAGHRADGWIIFPVTWTDPIVPNAPYIFPKRDQGASNVLGVEVSRAFSNRLTRHIEDYSVAELLRIFSETANAFIGDQTVWGTIRLRSQQNPAPLGSEIFLRVRCCATR